MASRSFVPAIDKALDEFLARDTFILSGEVRSVAELRRPEVANGICCVVADQLTPFLTERCVNAASVWIDPDELYESRPVHGYNNHCVTIANRDGVRVAIDLTAAQYGFDAFPLVSRFTPQGYTLDWDPATAPAIDSNAGIGGAWIWPAADSVCAV